LLDLSLSLNLKALETSPWVRRIFEMPFSQLYSVLDILCMQPDEKDADDDDDEEDDEALEKWSWQTSADSVAKGLFLTLEIKIIKF